MIIFKMIDKMLISQKFKDFFNKKRDVDLK
jgi:hypothetical protein